MFPLRKRWELSNIARLTSAVAVKKLSFMMFNTLVLLDMQHVVALIAEGSIDIVHNNDIPFIF